MWAIKDSSQPHVACCLATTRAYGSITMNRMLLPLALLLVALVAMAASLVWASQQLPQQVAAHFDARGAANSWMSRESHLLLMTLLGLGMPLLLVGVFYSVRFLPVNLVNLPHRDYWLAAERRAATCADLLTFGVWFAVFETLFFLSVHILVVQANLVQPARLSSAVWMLLAGFLVLVAGWLIALFRRFHRPPA